MRSNAPKLYALGVIWIVVSGLVGSSGEIAGGDSEETAESFTISGSTTEPLSPGVMTALDLKFTNPLGVPMSVSEVSVRLRQVNAPNADEKHPCGANDFAVTEASKGMMIKLPAGSTSTLSGLQVPQTSWPQVGMLDRSVNQDGCKGANLTLDYTGAGKWAI